MSDLKTATADHTAEEEEIIDVPDAEKETDVLRSASIKRVLEGTTFYGTVQDIQQGKDSGDRLYLVKYTDGDLEHLTVDQVRELSCTSEEVLLATQVSVPRQEEAASEEDEKEKKSTDAVKKDIVKKPASAAKATPKAAGKAVVVKKPARQ
eukprot:CAMPEP_0194484386 /NCGR_PEP_ID=MMETSP0253-20130528/5716_1 /TAXON_ID=2966 /ORGANISM="Noctiluca scintillans" /LENGTH=150 /DNA_ID=CAMNT_0039324179 /DNA_START=75 /DNA_END=527 /DNA_ORIENTATION=-